MANIGCCYDEGGRGLARNVFVAAYWFTQGAEAGNPAAQQKLGCYLRDGIAMNRDVSAWSYFIFGFSFSFFFLLSSEFLVADTQSVYRRCTQFFAARSWLEKSAQQGDAAAEAALALMLVKGEGGDRDVTAGMHRWRSAADRGSKRAQANLDVLEGLLRKAEFF